MAVDYTALANTASRLIRENGRTVKLRGLTPSGPAWNPSFSNADTDVKAFFTRYSAREIDGLVIQATDIKILLSSSVAPDVTMRLVDGSIDYSIIDVVEIKPGPTSVLYIVQARK